LIMASEECVFAIEHNRTDASLDNVGIQFDAAVIEETCQPFPMVERVADGLCGLGFAGKTRELAFEPGFEIEHERLASFLAHSTASIGALAADRFLNQVELGDSLERLAGDRCVAVLGDVVELTAQMRPTEGKRDRLSLRLGGDGLVGRISIALNDAPVTVEQFQAWTAPRPGA